MNSATFSASAPAITSMFPPTARDCSTSGGPRPCWPSWKPHDPGLASSQLRRYFPARALTEPADRLAPDREFMKVGLGDDDRARFLELFDDGGVVWRHIALQTER